MKRRIQRNSLFFPVDCHLFIYSIFFGIFFFFLNSYLNLSHLGTLNFKLQKKKFKVIELFWINEIHTFHFNLSENFPCNHILNEFVLWLFQIHANPIRFSRNLFPFWTAFITVMYSITYRDCRPSLFVLRFFFRWVE